MMERERQLTDHYEEVIRHLHAQLSTAQDVQVTLQDKLKAAEEERDAAPTPANASSVLQGSQLLALTSPGFGDDASDVPDGVASARGACTRRWGCAWVNVSSHPPRWAALNHCYAMLCDVYRKSVAPICDNMARYARSQQEWKGAQQRDDNTESKRHAAEAAMAQFDDPSLADVEDSQLPRRLSHADARSRVNMRHESNSRPVRIPRNGGKVAGVAGSVATASAAGSVASSVAGSVADASETDSVVSSRQLVAAEETDVSIPLPAWPLPPVATPSVDHPPLSAFSDTEAFVSYVTQLHTTVLSNLGHVGELLELKDVHFNRIKADLVAHMVARRRHERKIASSQVVLKFMFDTNARLRTELRKERNSARCVGVGGRGCAHAIQAGCAYLRIVCWTHTRPARGADTERARTGSVASFSTGADVVSTGAGAGAGAGGAATAVSPGRQPSVTVQRIVDRHRVAQEHDTVEESLPSHRSSLPLPKLAVRCVFDCVSLRPRDMGRQADSCAFVSFGCWPHAVTVLWVAGTTHLAARQH